MQDRDSVMYIGMKKALLVLAALLAALAMSRHALAEKRTCSGRVQMVFDLSAHSPGKEARLWVPYPVSGEYQTISNVRVKGTFEYWAVYTDSRFQTPMLHAYWGPRAKRRVLSFSFDVTRRERIHRNLPGEDACLDKATLARYLSPPGGAGGCCNVTRLAGRITAGRSTVLDKARAIYDWICDHMHRDPGTKGCGRGDVCASLQRLGGKCADIHSMFVALARASGVPAREVFGLRLGRGDAADITRGQHCWAEFLLPGYGWVVVDPGDVLKGMLEKGLGPGDPEAMALREYYWGAVDPYRVRLSRGRNLVLNPRQRGPEVNYLMYPFAQVGGTTLDWLSPEDFRYSISWRRTARPGRR